MKHTKEPWRVEGLNVLGGEEINSYVCTCSGKATANAQRIVACVNACEGVTNEDLEAYGRIEYELFNLQARLNQSERIRRKALNKVKELLKDAEPITHTQIQAARIIEILEQTEKEVK